MKGLFHTTTCRGQQFVPVMKFISDKLDQEEAQQKPTAVSPNKGNV